MTQTWHNLLFAHWPMPVDVLRPLVPADLTIDLFGGQAWIGLVVFRLSGVRLRGCPAVPFVAAFPEINVRTYVHHHGRPGVHFLSLDADNRLAIALARPWFRLAYFPAAIAFQRRTDGISFSSRRTAPPAPPARFSASYRPTAAPFRAPPGSLAHWLTERYCYYSADRQGRLYRCDIHHAPWRLQPARALIQENTMALAHGIVLPSTAPTLHYAHYM
ncbi:MAG TPA: DUF2071 domain-containing protein, partial [Chloroflexia bacterium]|nr:DUF2071 domain-containing protein [Chloroflexia bacterium]